MIDDNRFWIDPETGERHERLDNDEVQYIGCIVGGLALLVSASIGLIFLLTYCLAN